MSVSVACVIVLRPLVIRWQLLNLAGDRRLLTFHSTPYWGIGNAMFAFSSSLAATLANSDGSPPFLCFDAHLSLRATFPLLADWPACTANDLLELLGADRRQEKAYAM